MAARNSIGIIRIRDVMHTADSMERLAMHASAKTNSRNDRKSVFSLLSVPKGYKTNKADRLSQLSFETPG